MTGHSHTLPDVWSVEAGPRIALIWGPGNRDVRAIEMSGLQSTTEHVRATEHYGPRQGSGYKYGTDYGRARAGAKPMARARPMRLGLEL